VNKYCSASKIKYQEASKIKAKTINTINKSSKFKIFSPIKAKESFRN
jgi:hypothetical protein